MNTKCCQACDFANKWWITSQKQVWIDGQTKQGVMTFLTMEQFPGKQKTTSAKKHRDSDDRQAPCGI